MKSLSICVGLFGFLALAMAVTGDNAMTAVLGAVAVICAFTTFGASKISSFLKIFVGIFSTEAIVFGLPVLAGRGGLWPADYAEYLPPESLPLTVAIFSILVYLVAQIPAVRQITRIADRYFEASGGTAVRIWPFRRFTAGERTVAIGMVVFLVLLNQVEVGVNLRLTFFRRDLYDALQNYDAPTFWDALLLGFTPWAFAYVGMLVVEFFAQF